MTVRDLRNVTQQNSLLTRYDLDRPLVIVLTLHAIGAPEPACDSADYRGMFVTERQLDQLVRDLKRAGIEYKVNDEQADPKCLRPTFNSHLEHAGIDLTLTGLLMRHKPAGGMALTLGTYGDETALLKCKRQAIGQLETWLVGQREPEVVQEWCSA